MISINSYSERILSLTEYSAPMRIISVDAIKDNSYEFHRELEKMFGLPKRQVLEYNEWVDMTLTIRNILTTNSFDDWNDGTYFKVEDAKYSKDDFLIQINDFIQDASLFSVTAIRNIIYLASEGSYIDVYEDYNNGVDKIIRRFIFDTMIVSDKLSHDHFSFWVKTTNLLFQTISSNFKKEFNRLFEYQVPYGLSPKLRSFTIDSLFENTKKIAVFPLAQGSTEVGNAISQHHWGIALETKLRSGAIVLILISSISISDRVYQWNKLRENTETI